MNFSTAIQCAIFTSTLAFTSQAGTIISIGGNAPSYFNLGPPANSQVLATTWTTTDSYSNVSILATLFNNSQFDAAGVAYLATSTTAVDSAPFSLVPGASNLELLTEATLAPATYYLVLIGKSDADFGWLSPDVPTIFAGPGVTEGPRLYANPSFNPATSINVAYPPGSQFATFDNPSARLLYSVIAADVPEPSYGAITAGLLALGTALARAGSPSKRKQDSPLRTESTGK